VLKPHGLVAGIYGMNFRHMPEMEWVFGYALAIGLMLASAILPYWFALDGVALGPTIPLS
jgi:magnesium transporter